MAEERKKPKIDLKSRIPSKTVKGLTPVAGGAIPPPPGAVPAPPPDLLGSRRTPAPRLTGDPNDPLGAATAAPSAAPAPVQQIVVVQGGEHDEHHAGPRGKMVYVMVAAGIAVGLLIGFVSGMASKGSSIQSKAIEDAKELRDKVLKTNEGIEKFLEIVKSAQSDLDNKSKIDPPNIDAIKNWSSGFSAADLKSREIAYLGADTAGKLIAYANKVNHIDEMRAALTKGNRLAAVNERLKQVFTPPNHSRYGVRISKPGQDAPWTTADIVDFGEPLNLKTPKDIISGDLKKEPKLKAKSGEADILPQGGEKGFLERSYVSVIESKDWQKACPVYSVTVGGTKGDLDELRLAIEGTSDDASGVLKQGAELATKLKALVK